MLYKLVLVTDPLDHSERIYSPSNLVPKQNTNLEHLELLRLWGLEASGSDFVHDTNSNKQSPKSLGNIKKEL